MHRIVSQHAVSEILGVLLVVSIMTSTYFFLTTFYGQNVAPQKEGLQREKIMTQFEVLRDLMHRLPSNGNDTSQSITLSVDDGYLYLAPQGTRFIIYYPLNDTFNFSVKGLNRYSSDPGYNYESHTFTFTLYPTITRKDNANPPNYFEKAYPLLPQENPPQVGRSLIFKLYNVNNPQDSQFLSSVTWDIPSWTKGSPPNPPTLPGTISFPNPNDPTKNLELSGVERIDILHQVVKADPDKYELAGRIWIIDHGCLNFTFAFSSGPDTLLAENKGVISVRPHWSPKTMLLGSDILVKNEALATDTSLLDVFVLNPDRKTLEYGPGPASYKISLSNKQNLLDWNVYAIHGRLDKDWPNFDPIYEYPVNYAITNLGDYRFNLQIFGEYRPIWKQFYIQGYGLYELTNPPNPPDSEKTLHADKNPFSILLSLCSVDVEVID